MSNLKALHLAKSYKDRHVVEDVSIAIEQGQIVGLLGPNGAGKTTCFYMIIGLIKADQGQILIDGEDITKLPMHARARKGIGYLPQESSIFRKLTVNDNILAILETRKDLNRSQRKEKLLAIFSRFALNLIEFGSCSGTGSAADIKSFIISAEIFSDSHFWLPSIPSKNAAFCIMLSCKPNTLKAAAS